MSDNKSNKYIEDAEMWGNALNKASWEFLEAYQDIMGENECAKLFNCCKPIIRRCILKYLEAVDKQGK